jgi:hypothetical protein
VQGAYHTVEWQPIDKYWCSTNPPLWCIGISYVAIG